ncbi:sensor histidine kinase [Aliarcobacter skirrowii]|uniref:sensor histidine kinase n=3 Tax=Aliarcobacter skirrowii TaxID=28200 RepID=UPI0029BEB7E1|nr:sensor histidine kinase [Aliarcobacter skirrowii]MDX4028652.1 sensor histidine kinase [Aliarcobacter skirrowii]
MIIDIINIRYCTIKLMKKLLFLFLLFTNSLSYNINNIDFLTAYLSENDKDFKKLNFTEYINKYLKQFTIKFEINKNKILDKTYYLQIVSDKRSIVYSNVDYEIINSYIFIKIDKTQKSDIFFKYIYNEPKLPEFRWKYISEFEYKYLLPHEGILYGVSYGIIFCAFLYYLIIFLSTKKNYFLYYSLMQFFILISLLGIVYFSYQSYPKEPLITLVNMSESLAFLFTIIFAKTVLNTKEKLPLINKFLILFIIINLIDLIFIIIKGKPFLYINIPFYISFLIPLFAGVIATFNKDKNAIFYSIGWLVVSISLYLAEYNIFEISGIYILHIGMPLESLIFSFALGYMLNQIIKEKNEKEKLLIHQNKLASMGEMINNIAHQWRQPLAHLSFINMNLELAINDKNIDKKFIKNKLKESNLKIAFMSNTIDIFKDFYKINRKKESFLISCEVQKAIDIMKPIFDKNSIFISFEIKNDKQLTSYENEYSQVVLNILTNSKDILICRNIKEAKIKITLEVVDNISKLSIIDNAGGIENKNINHIFEPYFTTKEKGSGIGLYMSKMIIENHFKGTIEAKNMPSGACFSILI